MNQLQLLSGKNLILVAIRRIGMCQLTPVKKKLGCGIIVRDHMGFVIAAQCDRLDVFQEPVIAEALASLVGVEFSRDLGLPDIILEGDSLQVVQTFCESGQNFRPYGQIINDA
jgi:hypothetical protein